MKLSDGQLKIASEFCNDVAKGVMLAVILGQNLLVDIPLEIKIYASIAWFTVSISLLFSAIMISRHI